MRSPIFDAAVRAYKADLFDEAAAICQRWLKHDARNFDALHLLGTIRLREGRMEQALDLLQRACAVNHRVAQAHLRLAIAARKLDQLGLARQSYQAALDLDPQLFDAWNGLGMALAESGCNEQSVRAFQRALALQPENARANWNLALVLLASGEYGKGWQQYEWRWKVPGFDSPLADSIYPVWLGNEDVRGKTILLAAEQGLGDTLQFCRYAPLLIELGAKVIMRVPPSLKVLLTTLHPHIHFDDTGAASDSIDFCCPLLSLPLAFKTLIETIPAAAYLHADPLQVRKWAERMGSRSGLRVGLAWAGGAGGNVMSEEHRRSTRRSLKLSMLAPLAAFEGIDYFSLQLGDPSAELAQLAIDPDWHGPKICDLTSEITNFADTAALVENLDLVLTCDTSVAHLAGAMGKPVWVLSRFDGCWRWLLGRTDSPWYPSARIFRQTRPNDWSEPLAEVMLALSELQRLHVSRV